MIPLLIIGAGGHGREILDIVTAINEVNPTYNILGFIDDGVPAGTTVRPHRHTVLGGLDAAHDFDAVFVPAIGSPSSREEVVRHLSDHEAVELVHPAATIGSHVHRGTGLVVAAGARLTHAVTLGKHVHVNVNSTISHDCVLGDYVTVTPGVHVSGSSTIGDRVWLGVGSVVKQGVTIGADGTVGAGAAVVTDLPAGQVSVGVPAVPIDPSTQKDVR